MNQFLSIKFRWYQFLFIASVSIFLLKKGTVFRFPAIRTWFNLFIRKMTQSCRFFSWTGAKEAFLNRHLLYRDEVVKKAIHDLASPCYSLVLTSPQTALTVAHARKEMVKLTLTGEDKVAQGWKLQVFLLSFFNKTFTFLPFIAQLSTHSSAPCIRVFRVL